jgi:hypothetical protein
MVAVVLVVTVGWPSFSVRSLLGDAFLGVGDGDLPTHEEGEEFVAGGGEGAGFGAGSPEALE